MLQKLKASLGIGAAKVDAVTNNARLTQGDVIEGTIQIIGGDIEQHIDAIHVKLCTEVKVEIDDAVSHEDLILHAFEAV